MHSPLCTNVQWHNDGRDNVYLAATMIDGCLKYGTIFGFVHHLWKGNPTRMFSYNNAVISILYDHSFCMPSYIHLLHI